MRFVWVRELPFTFHRPWDIERSIFNRRKSVGDGRGYTDTAADWTRRFETDWTRVVSTQRFRKLVSKELADREISEIIVGPLRALCEKEYPNIMAAFYHYSAFDGEMGLPPSGVLCLALPHAIELGDGGTSCFCVRENSYLRFVQDIIGSEEKHSSE